MRDHREGDETEGKQPLVKGLAYSCHLRLVSKGSLLKERSVNPHPTPDITDPHLYPVMHKEFALYLGPNPISTIY